MKFPWRGDLFGLLLFIQAALAGFALEAQTQPEWLLCLGISVVLSLFGWVRALMFTRAILDTPSSKVASAAQGYVELNGRAEPHQGVELLTPHTQLPCLWYRYRVERQVNNRWQYVDSAESTAPFDLCDDSSRCTLHPEGAHIQSTHRETRREGDYRHTETVLLKNDRLYALGNFSTHRPAVATLNARRDEGELLATWKLDQAELHRRFDLDDDGNISPKEWALARLAARREIARQHQTIRLQPGQHEMRAAPGLAGLYGFSRPYLISNLPPGHLGKRYRWLSIFFFVLFWGALSGIAWVLKTGA